MKSSLLGERYSRSGDEKCYFTSSSWHFSFCCIVEARLFLHHQCLLDNPVLTSKPFFFYPFRVDAKKIPNTDRIVSLYTIVKWSVLMTVFFTSFAAFVRIHPMLRTSSSIIFPLQSVRRQYRAPENRRPSRIRNDLRSKNWQTDREHRHENCPRSGEYLTPTSE